MLNSMIDIEKNTLSFNALEMKSWVLIYGLHRRQRFHGMKCLLLYDDGEIFMKMKIYNR